MSKNEGTVDRLLRALVLAPLLVLAGIAFGVGTPAGVIALVLAAVMLITGIVGFCPLYALLHTRTNRPAGSH
jgi:hypothetical protein